MGVLYQKKCNKSFEQYKARLATKGIRQVLEVNYIETFGLVIKLATIQIVLYLTFTNN